MERDLGGRRARSRRRLKFGLGLTAVAAAGIGILAWWLGYFSEPPEEASLEASVAAAAEAESADTDETGTGSDGSTSTTAAAADPLSGTWAVQSGQEATFAGYRINEVLTTIGDFEVVGRTGDVTGTVTIDATTISSVDVVVDMATLTTDNDRRDASMRSQSLETDTFPTATFTLTTPIELAATPAEGETVSVTAVGDLTVHGVTLPVEFPLEAQWTGTTIVVVGQLPILLSDFAIDAPQAPIVAGVEDSALLELSLVLAPT